MVQAPKFLGPRTMYWILKVLALLGCLGSGLYCSYKLIWDRGSARWTIIYAYLIAFSVMISTAELGLLTHPAGKRFGLFLTTYAGRALFYIFMGGLQLNSWGFVPGVWIVAGGLNLATMFMCSEQLSPSEANAGVQPQQQI